MNDIVLSTLVALMDLCDGGAPHVGMLARYTGASPTRVAEALLHLEARGLADAGRVRLTLSGLAAAAALRATVPARLPQADQPSEPLGGIRTTRSVAG